MYQIFQECSKHSIKCTKCTITFQTTFFLKQNYRLTIIHFQTLQLSCNSFKLSQESCYLYLSYIDYRYALNFYTLNFPHTIQALNPFHLSIPYQKPYTTVQYLHTLSKMYLHMFFFIYSLPKTEISTQTFISRYQQYHYQQYHLILIYSIPYQYSLKSHYNTFYSQALS